MRKRMPVCLLSVLSMIAALAMPLSSREGVENGPFSVSLRLDRYTFTEDEPVTVQVVVKNISGAKASFMAYDLDYTTYQPVVYGALGKEAEIIVPYRLMNRRPEEVIRDVVPRMVELMPGESISVSINLRSIYRLTIDTDYRVKAFFFSDMRYPDALPSANMLTFRINRAPALVKKSGVVRQSRDISPSEVVLLALNAEKNGTWDNYLKYIRPESFINAFPDYVRLYNGADEIERLKILEDFAKFLTRARPDYLKEFTILDEMYPSGPDVAYVDVSVKRYAPRWLYTYKYRYTLEKYRNYWLIVDLEATVLKGEK